MAKWFSVARNANAAEIGILSDIGAGGVTASDFKAALDALGKVDTLKIRISSDGGDVFQGFAMYNMLRRHAARKLVTIDGLAASMASVIAMAGDKIVMPSNAMMMIHNPYGGVIGGAEQVVSFGEALDKMRESIAGIYAGRTGLPMNEVTAMMDRETWLDAEEAVSRGFADDIEAPVKIAASFDVSRFKNAPKDLWKPISATDRARARWRGVSRRAWNNFNNG